ncbi:MAG: site-specific DNA-methyltransferase [Alphaproteobacteria bacterium]|nr:site-specific DNA-methyltransferase [Alphaproteobacteria bacterium]
MFPVDFAFDVVKKYSKQGDLILDPFAGRGSSIYAGGVLGRHSLGIEINPVGWLYGAVKLEPAAKAAVLSRLKEIDEKKRYYGEAMRKMPRFFRMCYCDAVLKFLISARRNLNWKHNAADATLMSIILVYLHGKIGEGLSNQMRMTKAMGPDYSVRWWQENGFSSPPELDPRELITRKIDWRYMKGQPRVFESRVIFGDSTVELERLVGKSEKTGVKFSLLFTSPPYCDVTDYHADQWLRLWLLGGPDQPKTIQEPNKGRFVNREKYRLLLEDVFGKCSKLMADESTVYVRTDKRQYTFETTLNVLTECFPNHKVEITDKPFQKRTQTELHGNKSTEKGEVDIVLTR